MISFSKNAGNALSKQNMDQQRLQNKPGLFNTALKILGRTKRLHTQCLFRIIISGPFEDSRQQGDVLILMKIPFLPEEIEEMPQIHTWGDGPALSD